MNSRASSAAILGFFLFFTAASAFNITTLLNQHSDFSSFNDYLTQTKLADEINSRATITILAVDNSAISSLNGKPIDLVQKILSAHVILDYFNEKKLNQISTKNSTELTTLFQSSGLAVNQQGFIKVALINEGEAAFGSAVKGAPINAKMVQSVLDQPYNISVLQVTELIDIPGIDSKPSSPPPSQAPAQAPKKPQPKSPSPAQADAPTAQADAPKAETPAAEDAPVSSPPKPAGDGNDAVSPGPSAASGASRVGFAGVAVVLGLISSIMAL